MRSVLLHMLSVNKMSFRSFFEGLKSQGNSSIYWGIEELVKIDKAFNFGVQTQDYDELISMWGKKIRGKISMFDLASILGVQVESSS